MNKNEPTCYTRVIKADLERLEKHSAARAAYYERSIKPDLDRMERRRIASREYQRKRRKTPEFKVKRAAHESTPGFKAKKVIYDKRQHLKRVFKMSLDQFEAMVRACGERCPACKTPFSQLLRERPVVDHCHRTKAIRGLLCRRCNLLLGHAHDNPGILRAAARYLDRIAKREASD